MRLVTIASYMGTGSSAIADVLREFNDVSLCGPIKYEHVLLHIPNGLFDLEEKLLHNNNALRSDEAIRSFKSTMEYLYYNNFGWFGSYQRYIGPRFLEIVDEFVDSISGSFNGQWYYRTKPMKFSPVDLVLQIGACVLKKRKWSDYKGRWGKICKTYDSMVQYYAIPTAEKFYIAAQKFINDYIQLFSPDVKDNTVILADQLLLPHNLSRVDKYFNRDFRLIIVDRDPRDVFLLNKYFWRPNRCGVPIPMDVKQYCDYFKKIRQIIKPSNTDIVMNLMFEDLVYDYDNICEEIARFIGISNASHTQKRRLFKPENSINNTQVFNGELASPSEQACIEQNLPNYLYKFPYRYSAQKSSMFDYDE